MNTWQKVTRFGLGVVALILVSNSVLAQVPAYETGNEDIPLLI